MAKTHTSGIALWVASVLVGALAVIGGCHANTIAAPLEEQRQAGSDTSAAAPIAGGYGGANEETPYFREARARAIAEVYRRHPTRALVESATAEVQVVAGLNYRFIIAMSGDPETRPRYEVVIFRSLSGDYSVTDFKKL